MLRGDSCRPVVSVNTRGSGAGRAIQSANKNEAKCQKGILELSLEEMAIINVLKEKPTATQKQIAELIGKSERTVKRRTVEMQEKGLIVRENGKRNEIWKMPVKL